MYIVYGYKCWVCNQIVISLTSVHRTSWIASTCYMFMLEYTHCSFEFHMLCVGNFNRRNPSWICRFHDLGTVACLSMKHKLWFPMLYKWLVICFSRVWDLTLYVQEMVWNCLEMFPFNFSTFFYMYTCAK